MQTINVLYVCKRFVSDLRTKLLVGGAWAFSALASFPMFFISDEIREGVIETSETVIRSANADSSERITTNPVKGAAGRAEGLRHLCAAAMSTLAPV